MYTIITCAKEKCALSASCTSSRQRGVGMHIREVSCLCRLLFMFGCARGNNGLDSVGHNTGICLREKLKLWSNRRYLEMIIFFRKIICNNFCFN